MKQMKQGRVWALLCALCLSWTSAPLVYAQDPLASLTAAQRRKLVSLLQEGDKAYNAGQLERALELFEEAFVLAPVADILYRKALCYERLEQDANAIKAYEGYLKLAPDASNRGRVEVDIERLRGRLKAASVAMLSVVSTPTGAKVRIVNGEELGVTPLESKLEPGEYVVEVSAPKRLAAREEVKLYAGQTTRLNVALATPSIVTVTTRPSGVEVYEVGTGKLLGLTPLEVEREPGPWRLVLRAHGYQTQQIEGSVDPGEKVHVERALMSTGDEPWHWTTKVGVGSLVTGGASLIASIVLWTAANSAIRDANNTVRTTEQGRREYISRKERAEDLQMWTVLTAMAGGALVLGGAGLIIFGPSGADDVGAGGVVEAPAVRGVSLEWRF
jgi:hypothetical protein